MRTSERQYSLRVTDDSRAYLLASCCQSACVFVRQLLLKLIFAAYGFIVLWFVYRTVLLLTIKVGGHGTVVLNWLCQFCKSCVVLNYCLVHMCIKIVYASKSYSQFDELQSDYLRVRFLHLVIMFFVCCVPQ